MAPTGELSLEFRVLGAFEVAASGRVVEIGSPKQRALLALWRGPAFAGIGDVDFARVEAARLEEARLSTVEALAAAEIARDRPEAAVAVLEPHVGTHPLREGAWGQLMTSLYRLGRQGEA